MKFKDTGPMVTFTSEEVKAKMGQKVRSSGPLHEIPYGSIGVVVECYQRASGEDEWGARVEFVIQGRDEPKLMTFTKNEYYGYLTELDENNKPLPLNAEWQKHLEEHRLRDTLRNIGRNNFHLKDAALEFFVNCVFHDMFSLAQVLTSPSGEYYDLQKQIAETHGMVPAEPPTSNGHLVRSGAIYQRQNSP